MFYKRLVFLLMVSMIGCGQSSKKFVETHKCVAESHSNGYWYYSDLSGKRVWMKPYTSYSCEEVSNRVDVDD